MVSYGTALQPLQEGKGPPAVRLLLPGTPACVVAGAREQHGVRRWGRVLRWACPVRFGRSCCPLLYGLHLGEAVVCGSSVDLPPLSPAVRTPWQPCWPVPGGWRRPWARGRGVKQPWARSAQPLSTAPNCACGPGAPQGPCTGLVRAGHLFFFLSFLQTSKK